MEAIKTFKLTKKFGELIAVNEIELAIKEGELFSLLGPNGAGKTTTINMLCCLLKPTKGTATIFGYDILKDAFKIKELIGVCPQETAVAENLNAYENLELIGKLHNLPDHKVKRISAELLERVGLKDRAKDQVKKYSGGMKRRLSLIMALVNDPLILFLDEPTVGLDPQSRRAIWEYIMELKGKKTILLTTHYMEEADFLSDRIGIIDSGRIVALGTSSELKSQYTPMKVMRLVVSDLNPKAVEELKKDFQVERKEDELRVWGKSLDFKGIIDLLHSFGIKVHSATLEEPSLEDVFLTITGKELRE